MAQTQVTMTSKTELTKAFEGIARLACSRI
jgi:hypothetical protein